MGWGDVSSHGLHCIHLNQFLCVQLALERGHTVLAEQLAARAGKQLPPMRVNSVLAHAARANLSLSSDTN